MKTETELEFIPNSPDVTGRVLHVSKSGSDDGDGSEAHPFATLNRAARELVPGSVVLVGGGVYREEIALACNGHRYHPEKFLLFLGRHGEKVWIKGSDLFTPAWRPAGEGIWQAALPAALFADNAYNPYRLDIDTDSSAQVRPCAEADELPRTRGGIFFDGSPCLQAKSRTELTATENRFLIEPDGRSLLVHTPEGRNPDGFVVELAVRRRCFFPEFAGTLFYETRNIDVSQAAEPGPLCGCLPERFRSNRRSGLAVERTLCFRSADQTTALTAAPDGRVLFYAADTSGGNRGVCVGDQLVADLELMESRDRGVTWSKAAGSTDGRKRLFPSLFSDRDRGFVARSFLEYTDPSILFTMPGNHRYFEEYSFDNGATWSEAFPVIDSGYYHSTVKLADGSYIRSGQMSRCGAAYDEKAVFLRGAWNGERITWTPGAEIVVPPERSDCGVAEPNLCQFADGRLFVVLRQGARLASQDSPGIPSGKLCAFSSDGGRSWSEPAPLLYDNGGLVYSPRCFQNLFTSKKNGRSYLVTNLADGPCFNCDPRTRLQIAEIDPATGRLKRGSIAVIEEMLPGHPELVRFSNFAMTEEPTGGNLILLLKLELSEFCQVRHGLDFSVYRYEVMLPEEPGRT